MRKLTGAIGKTHPDVTLALLIFVTAASIGMTYLETWGGRPTFWQVLFGPGVMWACGHEYRNPALDEVPGFEAFIRARSECFSCENIPEDVETAPPGPRFDPALEWERYFPERDLMSMVPYQHFHLYLIGAVALCWRLFGVCWSAVNPLLAVMYGATVAVGYGLFRLGMRRRLALLCALLFAVAPLHLQQLPHYRDYAKAPFVLAGILILSVPVVKPLGRNSRLALAGLAGGVAGFGLGFRPDIQIVLPAFLVVVALFLPEGPFKGIRVKILMTAVCATTYIAVSWPVLIALRSGSNVSHWTLLGLFAFCDARLGVASPLYDFGAPYMDFYSRTVLQSYAQRVHGYTERLFISTPEYEMIGRAYLWEIVKRFPADIVLRAYAAVLRVLDELRVPANNPAPRGITSPLLVWACRARVFVLSALVGSGRYYTGLALALVGSQSLRLGFFALFMLLYFAGYTGIQFNLRHCFHLQFISLWVLGFLAQRLADLVMRYRDPKAGVALRESCFGPGWWCWWRSPRVRRAFLFVFVAAAAMLLPLVSLRVYQEHSVSELIEKTSRAPVEPIAFETEIVEGNTARVVLPALDKLEPVPPESQDCPVMTQYLLLKFADDPRPEINMTLRYEASDPNYDFTRWNLVLPASDVEKGKAAQAHARAFVPMFKLTTDAYPRVNQEFVGIEMNCDDLKYLRGVYRLTDLRGLPLLLNLTLPINFRELPKHQVLTR